MFLKSHSRFSVEGAVERGKEEIGETSYKTFASPFTPVVIQVLWDEFCHSKTHMVKS